MANSSPVANSQPTAVAKRPLLPPEEQFWKRYSPHNEFPLSWVGSVTIYFLLAVLIIAGIKLKLFDSDHAPLYVGAVEFDPSMIGGGGGDEKGTQGGTGDKVPDVKVGDVVKPDANLPPLPPLTLPKEKLDPDKVITDIAPPDKDETGKVDYTAAVSALAGVEKSTQQLLMDSLRDKGKGGDGTGGGEGTGDGTGTGNSRGPGKGSLSERQKRVLRWNMVFDTRNGEDYRQQLQSLGAILAIPDGPPDADGVQKNFMVIRELRRSATPQPEDLKKIQRIFWVDHRQESVRNLAVALGLPAPPGYFVAFFPQELEEKLAQLEANFARNHGRGQAIKETRFRIVLSGRTNKYEPMLVDQR